MTIPVTRSAPGVQLTEAALADLRLHLCGVRLPWSVLGGSVTDPGGSVTDPGESVTDTGGSVTNQGQTGAVPPRTVGVVVGDADPAMDHPRLLLLDRQNTPVAALVGSTTVNAASSTTVAYGEVEALASIAPFAAANGHEPAGPLVVVALRPWLTTDTAALGLSPGAAAEPPRRVVVLVPSESASPDAVPARTLRRCIDRTVAGLEHVDVEVRSAPLVWRDPDSDRALAHAVAETFTNSDTILLQPDDSSWRVALEAISAGVPLSPDVLSAGAARSLLQWRPPPERRGLVVMFTGLSGSGKSTLAAALVDWLEANTDRTVTLLDGDIVRQQLSSGLGFDLSSRDLNIRRIGYVAGEIARHHGVAVCAPIAPFESSRAAVRSMVEPLGGFVLIHVATPLTECERRDRKGLYAKARAGLVEEFTGISSPYEVPLDADLILDTSEPTVSQSLALVLDLLRAGHWLPPARP